jgi:hypothetical protein
MSGKSSAPKNHQALIILGGFTAALVIIGLQLIDSYVLPISAIEVTAPKTVTLTSSEIQSPTDNESDTEAQAAAEQERYRTDYAARTLALAHNGLYELLASSTRAIVSTTTGSTTYEQVPAIPAVQLYAEHTESYPSERSYPAAGAILPFQRIVAYYGNFLDTRMGALGEFPPEEMKRRLMEEVANWEAADPTTPVIPAIDYVAMVAQADAGNDGMYRRMMPTSEIDKAHALAKKVNGILILEVQAGLADLQTEIERFEPWLIEPDVHLALDPEFAMHDGARPGTVIGSVDASDVNRAAAYLKRLSDEHNLPPKVMLVHRFTQNMVQNATDIEPNDKVQIVMVMDGWGPPANKISTYYQILEPEPVQFTGFKVFYKNDMKPPSTALLTPAQILDLSPKPIFIQYQ